MEHYWEAACVGASTGLILRCLFPMLHFIFVSVKAWILSVVMWGNELSCLNHFSTVLPKSRTDLLQACSEIKALLEEKQHTVGLYNADCDMNGTLTNNSLLCALFCY